MPHLDPAWIALIGTLLGGIGLKILERFLGKGKEKSDEATQLRNELKQQVSSLKLENNDLEAKYEKLNQEYYDLRDKYAELLTKYTIEITNN